MFMLTGVKTNISAILNVHPFCTEICHPIAKKLDCNSSPSFPSDTVKAKGRMVGFGESVVGNALTFKILTDDTQKIICRSCIHPANDSKDPNKHLMPEEENKPVIEVVKSPHGDGTSVPPKAMMIIDPDDLIDRTHLAELDDSGQCFHAKIMQKIIDNEEAMDKDPTKVKFLVKVDGDTADEIVACNDLLCCLEEEMTDPADKLWHFKDIIAHEGPLTPEDDMHKGSSCNVMVAWEDGFRMFEPLNLIATDSLWNVPFVLSKTIFKTCLCGSNSSPLHVMSRR